MESLTLLGRNRRDAGHLVDETQRAGSRLPGGGMQGWIDVLRPRGVLRVGLLSGSLLLAGSSAPAAPQTGMGGAGTPSAHGDPSEMGKQDPGMVRLQEQQSKARNDDRQKRLVNDTARLYALAGELKDEVAKSDKDKLSIEVIRKADEIEHLAHSVKDRMKG